MTYIAFFVIRIINNILGELKSNIIMHRIANTMFYQKKSIDINKYFFLHKNLIF